MKGLLLRSVSGIVYVAIIVAGILLGDYYFLAFLVLFATAALVEWSTLVGRGIGSLLLFIPYVVAGVGAVATVYFFSSGNPEVGTWIGAVALFAVMVRLVGELYAHDADPLSSMEDACMGWVYVAAPIALLPVIYSLGAEGGYLVLTMFVMIWINDTGAFLVGSTIGRHKMIPRVSPKKSWEGTIGGILFAIATGLVVKYCFPIAFEGISLAAMLGLGAVVGATATWGDLIESLIKRRLGVKDSGRMIPGHGGILDRIDSLLLVAPATLLYLLLIGMI